MAYGCEIGSYIGRIKWAIQKVPKANIILVYVCKLWKALDGLKQEQRTWYGKIDEFLTHSGYPVTSVDSNLFIKAKEGKLAIVLFNEDDLIISRDYGEEILWTKKNL